MCTEKKFLGVCLLFVIIFFAIGCKKRQTPIQTLRVGLGAQVATLDPHRAQGLAELRVLSAIYEGLVLPFNSEDQSVEKEKNSLHKNISGGCAEHWDIKDAGKRIVFYIRKNSTWNNGEKLTSQDFVESWKRALTPETAAPNVALFDEIAGAKEFREGKEKWDNVGVRALSEKVLEITLQNPKKPISEFLAKLSHPVFHPIYHAKNLSSFGKNSYGDLIKNGSLISNGAFVLKENHPYEPIVVVKNRNYWGEKNVRLQEIEFHPIENRASEEIAFLSGVLDVTMSLPLNKVEAYKNDAKLKNYLRVDDALQVGYLVLNTRVKPLDEVEVRRALSLSLNRSLLCEKVLRGGQTPAWRFVPPNLQESKSFDGLHENINEAKEILAKLPEETRAKMNKIVLRFNTSEARKIISETIQAQWKTNLGVDITLENLEWKTFLAARQKGDYIIAQAGWSADTADAANFLELFASDNPNNVTGWKNKDYDEALKERNFVAAEEILLREVPCIPLYFNPNVYLISPRVDGWKSNPLDLHDWRRITVLPTNR